jgi:hypothetical protein
MRNTDIKVRMPLMSIIDTRCTGILARTTRKKPSGITIKKRLDRVCQKITAAAAARATIFSLNFITTPHLFKLGGDVQAFT